MSKIIDIRPLLEHFDKPFFIADGVQLFDKFKHNRDTPFSRKLINNYAGSDCFLNDVVGFTTQKVYSNARGFKKLKPKSLHNDDDNTHKNTV